MLSNFSQLAFFLIMGTLALFASIYFYCLKYDDDHSRELKKQRSLTGNQMYLKSTEADERDEDKEPTLVDGIKDVFKMMGHRKMRYLIP